MTAVVDIHCHNFNADDIPVHGFIQRVFLRKWALRRLVARVVDRFGQGLAQGYKTENEYLGILLRSAESSEIPLTLEYDLEAQTNIVLTQLQVSEPQLLTEAQGELDKDAELGPKERLASPDELKGVVAWALLLTRSRLEISRRMVSTYPEIELFTPMLVDLEPGLHDEAETTIREQIELQEKISRLSMIGRLVPGSPAKVHPFIGFDPRRQYRSAQARDLKTPLDLVKEAITDYGFIGVKLYPPMGFRPHGNSKTHDMTPDEAAECDKILQELYRWCEEEDVPITAHGNASNHAHEEYQDFSDPDGWARVLNDHRGLHLNLGHFGGDRQIESESGWPWKIAKLAKHYPHIYADCGNHRCDRIPAYLAKLEAMFKGAATKEMKTRFMFGSDWSMAALLPNYEDFLVRYRELYEETFDGVAAERFMGGTGLRFLGFSERSNRNRQRLLKRYERLAPEHVPYWLQSAGP